MVKAWTHSERREWGVVEHDKFTNLWSLPGPWHTEPDKMQWIDRTTDLDCLAVRNHVGAWCGYVGVPPGHPFHGRDYGSLEPVLEVHGGLTFADSCDEEAAEGHGICHIPEPGRPADVWWLGFDCGHYCDIAPRLWIMKEHKYTFGEWASYKSLPYVRDQCEQLAAQLAAIIVTPIEPKAEIGG